mgnify:CR=1 FL=1
MDFASWLQNELTKREWDQYEILRRAKMSGYRISHAQVSRIINGTRKAGPDACIVIAHALGVPREDVFRARGWLQEPSDPQQSTVLSPPIVEVINLLKGLPQGTQELVAPSLKAHLDTVITALDRPVPLEIKQRLAVLEEEFKALHPERYAWIEQQLGELAVNGKASTLAQ